jgi:hypothetical protein
LFFLQTSNKNIGITAGRAIAARRHAADKPSVADAGRPVQAIVTAFPRKSAEFRTKKPGSVEPDADFKRPAGGG